jgi:hypothetical protein
VSWINRVKSAFQKLKNLNVKNKEVKEWGVNIVTQLLKIVGLDGKLQPGSCGPRQIQIAENYTSDIRVEIRVPYCSDADLGLMHRATKILATEAMAMTPKDTGTLQDSQYEDWVLENEGKTVVGIVGYDIFKVYRTTDTGKMVFYALAVHNRDAYHGRDRYPNNPERAQWKFLETAIQNRAIRGQIQDLFA